MAQDGKVNIFERKGVEVVMAEYNVKLKLEGVEEARKQLVELVELGDKLQAQVKHLHVNDGDIIILKPERQLCMREIDVVKKSLEDFKQKINRDINFMILEDVEVTEVIKKEK
jgi:hypothetical protein